MRLVPSDHTLYRLLSTTGIAWGAVQLAAPRQVAGTLCPGFPADRTWLIRLLGARLLVQDATLFARPTRQTARAAAAIDGVHALSMLPALASGRYRRAAAISGATAAVGALALAVLTRD